ncbi:hypothetical protein OJ253_3389 [Cryptosporidium canis]|uniref:Uncharacterized protein n=1 Tax=Cryptosporidium canis TaxID=195482 RepID=A0A9D5DEH7_9CRYT|nr:hypothetical protein OJ253_3389 [Cryptosporidium canis]
MRIRQEERRKKKGESKKGLGPGAIDMESLSRVGLKGTKTGISARKEFLLH